MWPLLVRLFDFGINHIMVPQQSTARVGSVSRVQEIVQLFHVAKLAPRDFREFSKRLLLPLNSGAENLALQSRAHRLVFDLQARIYRTAPRRLKMEKETQSIVVTVTPTIYSNTVTCSLLL